MVTHSHGERNGLRAKIRREVIREWLKESYENSRFRLDKFEKKYVEPLEERLRKFNLKYPPKHGGGGNYSSNVMRIKTDNYCAVCGEDLKINHKIIHHISYPPDTITIPLCCKCHGMVHSGCYVKPSLIELMDGIFDGDCNKKMALDIWVREWKEYLRRVRFKSIYKSLKPKRVSQVIIRRREHQNNYRRNHRR